MDDPFLKAGHEELIVPLGCVYYSDHSFWDSYLGNLSLVGKMTCNIPGSE